MDFGIGGDQIARELRSQLKSILSTDGDLLFNGGMDRYFRAFDEDNGEVLWQSG